MLQFIMLQLLIIYNNIVGWWFYFACCYIGGGGDGDGHGDGVDVAFVVHWFDLLFWWKFHACIRVLWLIKLKSN